MRKEEVVRTPLATYTGTKIQPNASNINTA